jgi:hypothetical protein
MLPTIPARNVSNPGTVLQIALCYQRFGCQLFWQPTPTHTSSSTPGFLTGVAVDETRFCTGYAEL